MSKGREEVAGELVQAIVQARGNAIAPTSTNRNDYLKMYLSDEAIVATYKAVFRAMTEAYEEQ